MRRPGKLVKTTKGQTGIIYDDDPTFNEKLKVIILDDNYQPTGLKILSSVEKITLIGFID